MREAYAIIRGDTLHELVKNVHVLTEEGFEPVGAPFFADGDLGACWHQAMYKQPAVFVNSKTGAATMSMADLLKRVEVGNA